MNVGRLDALPRVRLAALPTPLEELRGLSRELGGMRLWVKRDDLTGFALGGSKVRKLELILGDAAARGADTLVACGDAQSNLARMVAAAAGRMGVRAVLVLGGEVGREEVQGNLLLDQLAGAEIRWMSGDFRDAEAVASRVADELAAQGRRPYVVPLGGSGALGSAGYVDATRELVAQLAARGLVADTLVVPVGSGGTLAGLVLGAKVVGATYAVLGVSVSRPAAYLRERVAALANDAAALLDLSVRVAPEDIWVTDEWIGPAFGALTPEAIDALRLAARVEGLFLDPVYTAKSLAAVRDLSRRGTFGDGQTVIFFHTGGLPALFAAAHLLEEPSAHPEAVG